jgi:hypothetical protein
MRNIILRPDNKFNTTCPICDSDNIRNKGVKIRKSGKKTHQYKCRDCLTYFSKTFEIENSAPESNKPNLISKSLDFDSVYPNRNGVVVTSAINDTPIFKEFFETLERYCQDNNYELLVIKNKYMNPSIMTKNQSVLYPPEVEMYALNGTVNWRGKFKILGDCNIHATALMPLTGIDTLSEGMTTIVGHPILQMESVPVNKWRDPLVLHSTGSISLKEFYSASKAGYRASFHHCFSALVIEFGDDDVFYFRQLLADSEGEFHDLDKKWSKSGPVDSSVEALVLGDEHVIFGDKKVCDATFYNKDSLFNILKPKYLVRHDIFDAISCGKHNVNRYFERYKVHLAKHKSIEYELKATLDHITSTTNDGCISYVIHSNHDDHLDQYLESFGDPKNDLVNALLYHQLSYLKLLELRNGFLSNTHARSALQIYAEDIYRVPSNVKFNIDELKIFDIELSMHGNSGPNGARGSRTNLAKIGERSIIGHSHTPGIRFGTWQVGNSADAKKMSYLSGPSSWLHSHCIIHKNGKRQLITIIDGRYRP